MLDFIRKGASSWMIKFLLGAIVIVFIFWGVGSFRSQRMEVVAKVNGQKIMTEDYKIEYNRTLERYRKMFGGSIPEGLLKKMNLKQQVLDGLINNAVINQQAARMGIRVSDQEVQQAIMAVPAFQIQGVFNIRAYEAALKNARFTTAGFEAQVKETLLMEELRALLGAGLAVPEEEVKEHYLYENQKINISFIRVDSADCEPEVKYTDQQLQEWFDTNKERYRTDPLIQLSYLLFDASQLEKEVKVTDEEIKTWYDTHSDEYHQAEQRKARHILLKLPKDASDEEVEATKKEIEDIRAKIKDEAAFIQTAKAVSEDPGSAKNGGDLGFFTRKAMVKPFADKAFSMKKGEISQPVRTQFGWHIILLEDIRPERTVPLEEVKEQIRRRLVKQQAKKLAWDRANSAYDEIIQMGSLEDYAGAVNATLEVTPMFSRKKPIPMLGMNPEVLNGLFALARGELSSLLDVPSGVLIAELKDKKMPYIPEFKDVKAKVIKDYSTEKARELCREKAVTMLAEAKEKGLLQVCKTNGCKVEETGLFTRTDSSANNRLPPSVAKTALSLYAGKVYPDTIEESGSSFFVLAFKEAKEADLNGLAAKKKEISDKLLKEKQQIVFQDWLKHAREKAEIKVSTNF